MTGAKLLKTIPFLSALTPKHLSAVYRLAREIDVPAGEPVLTKRENAEALFIVLSGRVKIFSDCAGKKRKTFAYLSQGDFFGEMALLEDVPRSASAQAVEDSRLMLIYKKDFQRLLLKDQRLSLYLLRTMSSRLRRANEEIEGMLFHNILGRLAKVMYELAKRNGQPWNTTGIVLKQHFTQQELADLVGTTREPLTRALSSLRRAGLVTTTDDDFYAVPDLQKLSGLCIND
jgi:CRP-like cAMP-binding protein